MANETSVTVRISLAIEDDLKEKLDECGGAVEMEFPFVGALDCDHFNTVCVDCRMTWTDVWNVDLIFQDVSA